MNATELADELENTYPFVGVMEIAATMLRQQQERLTKYELRHAEQRKRIDELEHQQQAEIEALKSVVYWLKENRPEVWEDIQKWRKYEPKR